jgi:ATP-dependent DNA helicase RecQ
MIFGDVSLHAMAARKPVTPEAFSHIPGVGEKKLQDLGETFLRAIRDHAEARGVVR